MSERQILKIRNKEIYPISHESCILDSNAKSIPSKYRVKGISLASLTNIEQLESKVGNMVDISSVNSINIISNRYHEILESLVSTLTSLGLELTDSSDLDVILDDINNCSASPYHRGTRWIRLGKISASLQYTCFELIDNTLYIICGYKDGTTVVKTNYSYNLDNDTLTTLTACNATRYVAGHCNHNGYIYVIGGYTTAAQKTNYRYNISSNAWETETALPAAMRGHNCFVINNSIYAVNTLTSSNYYYNLSSSAWTTLAHSLTSQYYYRMAQSYNNKIYSFAGYTSSNVKSTVADCYDPLTNTYTNLTSYPLASARGSSALLGDKIILSGGQDNLNDSVGFNSVYCYDIASNTYTTLESLPITMFGHNSVAYNDKCILIQYDYDLYAYLPEII